MPLTIEVEQEDDGRWLAEVPEIPGVLAYGQSRGEAIERARALALRLLAETADEECIEAAEQLFLDLDAREAKE